MNNNLTWVTAFFVRGSISLKFQNFMEKKHLKTIQKSNCFFGVTQKIFQEKVKDGFDSVVYIKEPKSLEDWQKYIAEFRPDAAKEFLEENRDALAVGDIVAIQSTGEVKIIEII